MKTYQDFMKAKEEGQLIDFIVGAISDYRSSPEYEIALEADEYEAERNPTINNFMRMIFNGKGQRVVDFTASNNKIASNFFHRLTTQRVTYSLGNGVSFAGRTKQVVDNEMVYTDATKEALGKDFDTVLNIAAKHALRHRVSYLFWNLDHADYFKATEFLPLHDEYNGSLRAGFRFWSLDWDSKPVTVVVYEEDGYEKYQTKPGSKGMDIGLLEPKRAYKQQIAHNEIDPDEVVGESNYSYLPIVPLWANENKQSDLVGMKAKIDAYDLVKSGFCDDLQDCAEVYWIVSNALGMTDEDLMKFRDRLKFNHVAAVDTDNSPVTPFTQEIPVAARQTLLDSLRSQIYDDYGALDVTNIGAGANITATEIKAAYQTMDEEADLFEYQVIQAIRGILNILGIDDVPVFQRNRVSNEKEQTDMVMLAANYLDGETVLRKLPFITPDEVETIMARKVAEATAFAAMEAEEPEEEPEV